MNRKLSWEDWKKMTKEQQHQLFKLSKTPTQSGELDEHIERTERLTAMAEEERSRLEEVNY